MSLSISSESPGFYVELSSKFISLVHTFYICLYSFSYLLGQITEEFFKNKLFYTQSFLIYDFILVLYFKKYFKEYKVILSHHAAFYIGLNLCKTYNIVAQGLCAEITNPFLYTCWLLYKLNLTKKLIFKFFSFCLYITFFIFRICNFGYLFYTYIP